MDRKELESKILEMVATSLMIADASACKTVGELVDLVEEEL